MVLIHLAFGILLPWLTGFYCLRAIEVRFSTASDNNIFRQAGYGLFLGYCLLQATVLTCASLLGYVTFWPVFTTLALLTIASAVVNHSTDRTLITPTTYTNQASADGLSFHGTPGAKITYAVIILLLGASALHMTLAAVEVMHQPVYPWDAWLAWVYRAKAWFYSGNVYTLASPGDWLSGHNLVPYTIDAYNYPTFASIVPFWASLSLGHWDESLINTPILLCGTALGMALYGQCREHGLPVLIAVTAVYLLISMPLVGTHLSLAGYADIWLAGFAGLGFVALIRGYAEKKNYQTLLGIGMIALGLTVKNEGVVWLYAALAFLTITVAPLRVISTLLLTAVALATLAWITGYTYIELPLLGGVGVTNNAIYIPFAGSHKIQTYSIATAYFQSFFIHTSWHLLWPLTLATVISVFFIRQKRLQKAIAVFLVIFAISQAFIFGLTEQGKWASHYTAINRLPLQFAPALVFSIVAGFSTLARQSAGAGGRTRQSGLMEYALPALLSTSLLVFCLFAFLKVTFPDTGGQERSFAARDLKIMVGGGKNTAGAIEINRYDNGIAIVSTGTVALDTALFPVIRYDVLASGPDSPSFFWRLAAEPDEVQIAEIHSDGTDYLALTGHPKWAGQITEAGLVLHGEPADSTRIGSLTFAPGSDYLFATWSNWMAHEPVSQRSVNFIGGRSDEILTPAPLVAGLWLVICLAFYWLGSIVRLEARFALIAAGFCALGAWMLLDLKWTRNHVGVVETTIEASAARDQLDYINEGYDQEIEALVIASKSELKGHDQPRILIVAEDEGGQFESLRAKYHLLPYAGIVQPNLTAASTDGAIDFVLIIRNLNQQPDGTIPIIDEGGELTLMRVISTKVGTLYRVTAQNI